jgi:hypothetical protein
VCLQLCVCVCVLDYKRVPVVCLKVQVGRKRRISALAAAVPAAHQVCVFAYLCVRVGL